MPDATTDPAAAYLADVRKRWDVFGEGDATPHLVAALEAVLVLAGEAAVVRDYSGNETNGRIVGWNLNPASVRAVISAELPGESRPGLRETGE